VKDPSGLARLALIHLDRMSRMGVPRADLMKDARLDEKQLADPDARIPLSALVRLWHAAATRVPEPALGLRLGLDCKAREFGLVGYTMAFSGTLGAAFQRFERYARIVSDALVVQREVSDGGMWVRLDAQPALRAFRPAADARLAALLSMCREITVAHIVPLTVQFPYRRPADVQEYERFFRAPLEFGCLATAFLLAKSDLARPVVSSDEALTGYLDRLADQTLSALGTERTTQDRVRRVLWTDLSAGDAHLDRTARLLGMSARALQRRLREEGTTFAAVLTKLRQDMAQPLLRDGRLAVSEVAFLLGYEDPSSFQRAFRRWSGISPRAFRRRPHEAAERRP
jgi:AraC-like DNA-binding protein